MQMKEMIHAKLTYECLRKTFWQSTSLQFWTGNWISSSSSIPGRSADMSIRSILGTNLYWAFEPYSVSTASILTLIIRPLCLHCNTYIWTIDSLFYEYWFTKYIVYTQSKKKSLLLILMHLHIKNSELFLIVCKYWTLKCNGILYQLLIWSNTNIMSYNNVR